jgi:anti-sigma regulatory factor (Ser/Thr protein kinase)
VVCAPEERCDLLRGYLRDGDSVAFMDLTALGTNPGRLIPAWRDWINGRSGEGAVHGIGESVWSGRTTAQVSELRYHEWLLNLAFAHAPAWSLLCPYDTVDQSDEIIEALVRSHPLLWDGRAGTVAANYEPGPYTFAPFAVPSAPYDETQYTINDLTTLRELVTRWAASYDLSADRTRDLMLAATEVASNSIRHGGGKGALRIWVEDGALVCEFRDHGVMRDPMAGRVRPVANQIGGCGLWFVHQLCDLVEIRSEEHQGTCIRLHMDLPDAQGQAKR